MHQDCEVTAVGVGKHLVDADAKCGLFYYVSAPWEVFEGWVCVEAVK